MSILDVQNVSIRYMTGDFKDIGLKEYVMRKLTKNYRVNEFWADKDISFSLEKGDMLGIIGTNGAGKSTLLKAISGIMEPTKGRVVRKGNVVALLELASGFDGDLTVKENAYLRGAMLGYTRKFMDETYDQIIDFAELEDFQDRPFKQLSSGMKSRLAFAIASLVQPEILILDEVLSVGDGAFRKKSENKMREIIAGGATTILVSHSIQQVREMCNKVLWLEKGRQIAFGNTTVLCNLYQQFLDKRITLKEAEAAWKRLNGHYDYLIVGGGLYGATFARQATDHGKHCLIVDRRDHMGGNLYCEELEGITVHKYGPHIFHTQRKDIWDYVNHYAKFLPCPEGLSNDAFCGIPEGGYNRLIDKLLEGSAVVTGMNYKTLADAFPEISDRTIYTGAIDGFFEYSLGHLKYRGLKFVTEVLEQPDYQGQAIVEYHDVGTPFVRAVEYKHLAGTASPKTAVTWESPEEWQPGMELYYPVGDDWSNDLYRQYLALAEEYPSVVFGGRLGRYQYYDMDAAIAAALELAEKEFAGKA